MSNPVRVLQIMGKMGRGGAENMIMNLYRKIDRNIIQFDFVVHTNEKHEFDDEIACPRPHGTGRTHYHQIHHLR